MKCGISAKGLPKSNRMNDGVSYAQPLLSVEQDAKDFYGLPEEDNASCPLHIN